MPFCHDISSRFGPKATTIASAVGDGRVGRVGGSSPLGIDRIVMLLCGPENQREVVLLPMNQRRRGP